MWSDDRFIDSSSAPLDDVLKRDSIRLCAVHKRPDRLVARVWGFLADMLCLAAAAVVLFVMVGRAIISVPTAGVAPGADQALPALAVHMTPKSIRTAALEQCSTRHFVMCLTLLDHAQSVDPAGDNDPAIQAARTDAVRALNEWDLSKRNEKETR
jgi:hypothetical protein